MKNLIKIFLITAFITSNINAAISIEATIKQTIEENPQSQNLSKKEKQSLIRRLITWAKQNPKKAIGSGIAAVATISLIITTIVKRKTILKKFKSLTTTQLTPEEQINKEKEASIKAELEKNADANMDNLFSEFEHYDDQIEKGTKLSKDDEIKYRILKDIVSNSKLYSFHLQQKEDRFKKEFEKLNQSELKAFIEKHKSNKELDENTKMKYNLAQEILNNQKIIDSFSKESIPNLESLIDQKELDITQEVDPYDMYIPETAQSKINEVRIAKKILKERKIKKFQEPSNAQYYTDNYLNEVIKNIEKRASTQKLNAADTTSLNAAKKVLELRHPKK